MTYEERRKAHLRRLYQASIAMAEAVVHEQLAGAAQPSDIPIIKAVRAVDTAVQDWYVFALTNDQQTEMGL